MGEPKIELKEKPGTAEFAAEYEAAEHCAGAGRTADPQMVARKDGNVVWCARVRAETEFNGWLPRAEKLWALGRDAR
jgi:hypothetical protein